jgi:hypothetical protein
MVEVWIGAGLLEAALGAAAQAFARLAGRGGPMRR